MSRLPHAFKDEKAPKSHHNGKGRRRSHSDFGIKPTDLHMSSILTNPLLAGVQEEGKRISGNDPMVIFEKAVSKGMMDMKCATLCLIAKKNEIIQSSVLSVQQGMNESGAGRKVLKWLWASGTTNDNSFMMDTKFSNILMEFIVAEELQEAAWTWIRRAVRECRSLSDVGQLATARKEMTWPLFSLVKAEASSANGLDAAYICLSRAAGYLKGMTASQMRIFLGPTGRYLSYATGVSRADRPPPAESAFDSFLSLIPVITSNTEYHFAHLNLHHPNHPTANLALSYLQSREHPPELSTPAPELVKRSRIIELGLTTARFLLEERRYDDADWVMNYLQAHYSDQLGGKRTIERAKAEASSLQLLEGLSFA
jgi:hypothetical protein